MSIPGRCLASVSQLTNIGEPNCTHPRGCAGADTAGAYSRLPPISTGLDELWCVSGAFGSNDRGRVANRDAVVRDIAGHDRAGADDRAIADAHPFQDDDVGADPR